MDSVVTMPNLSVDGDRLWRSLMETAEIGFTHPLMFGRGNAESVDPDRQTNPDFAGRLLRIHYAIADDREVVPASLDVD